MASARITSSLARLTLKLREEVESTMVQRSVKMMAMLKMMKTMQW